jgi:hypothetical protein
VTESLQCEDYSARLTLHEAIVPFAEKLLRQSMRDISVASTLCLYKKEEMARLRTRGRKEAQVVRSCVAIEVKYIF